MGTGGVGTGGVGTGGVCTREYVVLVSNPIRLLNRVEMSCRNIGNLSQSGLHKFQF